VAARGARAAAGDAGDRTDVPSVRCHRGAQGANPGELPLQSAEKFELVVNLKTAKALGLAIPEAFLLRADEVIE
jgi:putative ABC transport system substrate-binding protein